MRLLVEIGATFETHPDLINQDEVEGYVKLQVEQALDKLQLLKKLGPISITVKTR